MNDASGNALVDRLVARSREALEAPELQPKQNSGACDRHRRAIGDFSPNATARPETSLPDQQLRPQFVARR